MSHLIIPDTDGMIQVIAYAARCDWIYMSTVMDNGSGVEIVDTLEILYAQDDISNVFKVAREMDRMSVLPTVHYWDDLGVHLLVLFAMPYLSPASVKELFDGLLNDEFYRINLSGVNLYIAAEALLREDMDKWLANFEKRGYYYLKLIKNKQRETIWSVKLTEISEGIPEHPFI